MSAETPSDEVPTDLLYGVAAIAKFLDLKERVVRHKVGRGMIYSFRMGAIICSHKGVIAEWIKRRAEIPPKTGQILAAVNAVSTAQPDLVALQLTSSSTVAVEQAVLDDLRRAEDLVLTVVRSGEAVSVTIIRPGRPAEVGTGHDLATAWLTRKPLAAKGGRCATTRRS